MPIWRKHNPLQALAYLALKLVLFPAIWVSGIAYLLYGLWQQAPNASAWLTWVALVHTAFAFAIAAFVIAHIYLLTTGHSFVDHVRPMITGFDAVSLSPEEDAYLSRDEPRHIRWPQRCRRARCPSGTRALGPSMKPLPGV